jgi:hypothetical protein
LSDEDIRAGINLVIANVRAQERMRQSEEAAQAFVQQMAAKYEVGPDYILQDYLTGFVRVKEGDSWQT